MRRTYFLAIALAACSHKPAEPSSPSASEKSAEPAASVTSPIAGRGEALPSSAPSSAPSNPDADGGPDGGAPAEFPLLWNEPATFIRVTPKNSARAADYVVPHADQDTEDAECVVMTFGRRHGGTVDENVKRWIDQFHPALTTPRRMNDDINGMHATFIEVAGTFIGNLPPSRQGVSTPAGKPAWRLIGAILQAPSGLWFFKLTGPDLTVRIASRQFEDMVRSARPK